MGDFPENEPRQQSSKALHGLRDLVLTGEIQPGERLSEVALAARLNVSRTPLRAAMQRMEQEGLAEALPNGGYAVRRFSHQDVIDAIELRGMLEGMAARLAAERGVSQTRLRSFGLIVAALDDVIAVGAEQMNFARYEELNGEFHSMLSDLSGSDIVRREIARVMCLPFASPNAFVNGQVDIPAFRQSLFIGQAHHRAILVAITSREGSRAEALAREHARLARQNLDIVMDEPLELRRKVVALAQMTG